jgi:transcriptional regulator with XRE-family HTH domain
VSKDPATLIREARRDAGLTQGELARRLGTTQSAVARLERPGSNPRVDTLDRALRAMGRRLEVAAPTYQPDFDLTLLNQPLKMTPDQRLSQLEALIDWASTLMKAGERARGRAG